MAGGGGVLIATVDGGGVLVAIVDGGGGGGGVNFFCVRNTRCGV